jgi:hypothetical protein
LILFCYNNAIQCSPATHIELHEQRIKILEEQNDSKRLILAKLMLLKYVNIDVDLDIYNKYFNQVMAELSSDADRCKKIYVLKTDMKKFQERFPTERLALLIQLMIDQKAYKESIMIIMQQCQISIKSINQAVRRLSSFEEFDFLNDLEFEIPAYCNNMIRTLFIVCLIHLNYDREDSLINTLYNYETEKCSQQFLLLANTYYVKKNYIKAKRFYHLLLTNVKEFLTQMEIWLKYGNCCKFINNKCEDATNAYRNAVNLEPFNTEAALSLVNCLKDDNNYESLVEASNVIKEALSYKDKETMTADLLKLLIQQCYFQYEMNEYLELIKNARNILFGYMLYVLEPKNINALIKVDSKVQRNIVFHQILEENNHQSN